MINSKKLFLFILLASVFVDPIYSMKRAASCTSEDYSKECLTERAKRPRATEASFLDLAQVYPQIFEYILSFLDQPDKDNLTSTCRFLFERVSGFRIDPSLNFYFEIPSSLYQNDFWRCGYFTLYNAFKILNCLKEGEKNFLSLFRFVLNNLNNQKCFDTFLQSLLGKYIGVPYFERSFAWVHRNKKDLWKIQFEDSLCNLFDMDDVSKIPNLSIIDLSLSPELFRIVYCSKQVDLKQFPKIDLVDYCPILFERKKGFGDTKIPQVIVIKDKYSHWNVFIVTEVGIMVVDSYYEGGGMKSRIDYKYYAMLLYKFFNDK